MFIDGLSNLRGAVKPGEQTRLACRRPAATKRVDFCAEGNGSGSQRCSRTAALAAWSSFSGRRDDVSAARRGRPARRNRGTIVDGQHISAHCTPRRGAAPSRRRRATTNRDIAKEFQLLGAQVAIPILDRESLTVAGSFGASGKAPGQFATPVHDLTMDSKGNIYTGEAATAGRVQKFSVKE